MNNKIENKLYLIITTLIVGVLFILYWTSTPLLYSDEKCCPPEKKNNSINDQTDRKLDIKKTSHKEHKHKKVEHGDFCGEHNVPESECGICRPDQVPDLEIGHSLKIRMQSRYSAEKAGVETRKPKYRSPMNGIQLQGRITYNYYRLAHITSLAPGIIGRVFVKNGDYIKKGQKLAEIQSNMVVSAKENYLNALTAEKVKNIIFKREKILKDKHISSIQEFDQAMVQYKEALQKKRSSRQMLINLGLSNSLLKLLENTQAPTPNLPVVAPFDGTIISHSAVQGEGIKTGTKLMTLADLTLFWLEISIPEVNISQVQLNSKLKVLTDALPKLNLETRLTWISSEIHPKTRSLRARAILKNPKNLLKHGMYARVFLQPVRTQKVLTIPTKSLHYFSKKPFIFVRLEDDLYEVRRVSIGNVQGEEVEILKGLNSNEAFVAEHSFILKSELLKSRLGAGCVDN